MADPEYATFRDLVETVNEVDDKLGEHKIEVEKRLGRIEKMVLAVGILALVHPSLPLKGASFIEGAIHLVTYI